MRAIWLKDIISSNCYDFYSMFTLVILVILGYFRLKDVGMNGFLFLIPIFNLYWASLPSKNN
jgi:hypothetical protein